MVSLDFFLFFWKVTSNPKLEMLFVISFYFIYVLFYLKKRLDLWPLLLLLGLIFISTLRGTEISREMNLFCHLLNFWWVFGFDFWFRVRGVCVHIETKTGDLFYFIYLLFIFFFFVCVVHDVVGMKFSFHLCYICDVLMVCIYMLPFELLHDPVVFSFTIHPIYEGIVWMWG